MNCLELFCSDRKSTFALEKDFIRLDDSVVVTLPHVSQQRFMHSGLHSSSAPSYSYIYAFLIPEIPVYLPTDFD